MNVKFLGICLAFPEIKNVGMQLIDMACSIPVHFMHRK